MAEMTVTLRKTALNATHRAHKAKMVDFGGWDMPVEYSGLVAEHMAVRTGVGLFDVSHMGDIQFRGPGSLAAVQRLCMNDASKLAVGQAHYSAMLDPDGCFVDDVVVHKLSDNDYLIVINAGTREKDVAWVRKTVGHMPSIHISDYSDMYTQLAIQGPKAQATLQKLTDTDLGAIKNYHFRWGKVCGLYNVMIARTGYTGEDGFEIYIPSDEPTSGCGARCWRRARSSASCPAGWARAIRCGWRRRWRCTATRFQTRSTCSRPGWVATQSSIRPWILLGARRWRRLRPQEGRSASWWAWR
jgi:aminomethyltransferase